MPLIIKRSLWESIKHKSLDKTQKSNSGWPVSLKNVLLVKPGMDDFFLDIRENPLFVDMFSGDDKIALYLPDGVVGYTCFDGTEGNACGDIQLRIDENIAKNREMEPNSFYSTAYVWLMLEQVVDKAKFKKEKETGDKLEPGKVLPFFEHANLATKKGLDFLQHCLARKAIYHVLECEADSDYQEEGYYHFATALFPEKMRDIIEEEIKKLSQDQQMILKKRLFIPDDPKNWRTPDEVVKFADTLNQAIKDSLFKGQD